MRKAMTGMVVPFNVYEFRSSASAEQDSMKYNVGGIRMSEAAFNRLREEISLAACSLDFERLWGSEEASFHSGLVPVGSDIFRRIVVRASRIPMVETATFNLACWTDTRIYEVCVSSAVYDAVEKTAAAGK